MTIHFDPNEIIALMAMAVGAGGFYRGGWRGNLVGVVVGGAGYLYLALL